jgi:SAM-dependent methyltransferase
LSASGGRGEGAPSVVFSWKREDYDHLLRSCDSDDTTPHILRHMPRDRKVVEVGCGLGRFVKYLHDRGYDVDGLEYSAETVRWVNEIAPELHVVQGDALHMPYPDGSVGGVISLGMVEHFFAGCEGPLREMCRVLAPGGRAVLTVPTHNLLRQIKRAAWLEEVASLLNPLWWARRSNTLRRLMGRTPASPRRYQLTRRLGGRYAVHPAVGEFFEYRLRKEEFEAVLRDAGFIVETSVPIGHMDGVYHDLGRLFVRIEDWAFRPNALGRAVNRLLSRVPFAHNHMHLCVVAKPAEAAR